MIATASGAIGALAAEDVAALARAAGVDAEAEADIEQALARARAAAGADGAVVICGTLYLLSRLAAREGAR